MPSLVTSVVGGIQGASAAHNAAKKQQQGYQQAGKTVTDSVNQVNPEILKTAAESGQTVTDATARAGQMGMDAATAAGTRATTAADTLTGYMSPYMDVGSTAAAGLGDASKPFTADMMAQYSPAYQFQLKQGQQAAARAAAAGGVTGSGGTMKSLMRNTQDYAGTAFANAENIYGHNFDRLSTLAKMGQSAGTTAGEAGIQAAEYAGTAGQRGAEYAGDMGAKGAEYAGTANINARNLASGNTLSGASFLANTQMGAQNALAQGDLGAASAWNGMLSGIGQAGNSLLMAGMGGAPGTSSGWSMGNIGKNLWGTKPKSTIGYA